MTSTPTNITFPQGTVTVHLQSNDYIHEICGSNDERQDSIITPISTQPHVSNFRGYYCARFDYEQQFHPTPLYGIVQNTTVQTGALDGDGKLLSGYAAFPSNGTGKITVVVRVGTSFISVDQARRNIDTEIPDRRYSDISSVDDNRPDGPQTLEHTARITRSAWAEKLDLFALEGATEVQKEVFWTGVAHALQVDL